MIGASKKLLQATAGNAGGGDPLDITDVFSTYLYTGDYNTGEVNQHIKNNISLGSLGSGGSSVNFSGNQYLTRSDFSGNSDGKELTFSAWILFNDFENNFVFSSDPNGGGTGINVGYYSGKLRFEAHNSGGSVISQWHVDDSNTPFHQWFHLCFSVNTASGTGATKVYINDVAATKESVTSSNQNIDRTRTAQRIAVRGTDYKLTGNLAHVFMDYTYRDLDTESNRRLFIDANGGSTDPSTLSALNPIMYCPLTDDYTMGKNLGTGGDFTSNGGPSFSSLGTEATDDASGGMVWIKNRSSTDSHMLFDTERGSSKSLSSNETTEEVTNNPDTLTQFLADGFFLGDDVAVNTNNEDYASWTFRKAPKFFDVVTWTGDHVAGRAISHNLGSVPGTIIVKCTNASVGWYVYHRSLGNSSYLRLDATGSVQTGNQIWHNTDPTSTQFYVSNQTSVNSGDYEYVAYIFAHHDGDGEFGPDGDADVIKCGSYTGNGSTDGPVIDLGFEPQWFMWKRTNGTANWQIIDNMRGISYSDPGDPTLGPNSSYADNPDNNFNLTATGLKCHSNNTTYNASGGTYAYVAIRRGPLAPPESATEVFAMDTQGSSAPYFDSGFPVDMAFYRPTSSDHTQIASRMTGNKRLYTTLNSSEGSSSGHQWDYMDGWYGSAINNNQSWMWKRAPSFFDVVAYTGNGTAGHTVSHNLGVAPEMMWVKQRDTTRNWGVYHKLYGGTHWARLNQTSGFTDNPSFWNDTDSTSSVFTLGNDTETNQSSGDYIAYLFASLDGISKVGSYTGTGATLNIDCGFTSGARFVLIKRTNNESPWWYWDSERGIVAGNDPWLELNSTRAETTATDYIDPYSSGFTLTSSGNWLYGMNYPSGEYMFYAIA